MLEFTELENWSHLVTTWAIQRINSLLNLCEGKNYLEIGVENVHTFTGINAQLKIAVDPIFRFDFQAMQDRNTLFLSQDSDSAYAKLQEVDLEFDVIYLDGLHTFEQTYRDLLNAIDLLAPGGFILIDDVYPNDEYSFINNQQEALSKRKSSIPPGSTLDLSWHGDVFKVVAMVHDFQLNLDYRTFWGFGNPQTVVWDSIHQRRQPRFASIQEIATMNYGQLCNNDDILKKGTDEEILIELRKLNKKEV